MKNVYIILFLFINLSCSPLRDKESYLKEYQQFIKQIKTEWKSYSQKEWVHKSNINKTYSEDYFNTFYKELSNAEIIRVKRFNLAFLFYKGEINIQALFSGKYNNILKEQLIELKAINWEILLGLNDLKNEELLIVIDRLTQ